MRGELSPTKAMLSLLTSLNVESFAIEDYVTDPELLTPVGLSGHLLWMRLLCDLSCPTI